MITLARTILNRSTVSAEFIRYLLVGGVAFIADFGTLAILSSGLQINYLLATLLAFLVGIWVNYQLSVHWVFRYRAIRQHALEFIVFLLTGFLTLGLSLGIMALLVGKFNLYYLLAKCIATVFTLIANFSIRRALLFTPLPMHIAQRILKLPTVKE